MIKNTIISSMLIVCVILWWLRVEQEGLTKSYYRKMIQCQAMAAQ